MIVDCISDLHGHYPQLDGGDLLVVAGDLTVSDLPKEHIYFTEWLRTQKYKMKVFIGGNHDNALQKYGVAGTSGDSCWYLCDSGTEFSYYDERFSKEDEGFFPNLKGTLKIWGSPWTKRFKGVNPNCMAFMVNTEQELADRWALIPDDIDILITHSPPWSIFDLIKKFGIYKKKKIPIYCHVGSETLEEILQSIKPKLHIFGHIHESHGFDQIGDIIFVNASYVNKKYKPVNKPIRIIL